MCRLLPQIKAWLNWIKLFNVYKEITFSGCSWSWTSWKFKWKKMQQIFPKSLQFCSRLWFLFSSRKGGSAWQFDSGSLRGLVKCIARSPHGHNGTSAAWLTPVVVFCCSATACKICPWKSFVRRGGGISWNAVPYRGGSRVSVPPLWRSSLIKIRREFWTAPRRSWSSE